VITGASSARSFCEEGERSMTEACGPRVAGQLAVD